MWAGVVWLELVWGGLGWVMVVRLRVVSVWVVWVARAGRCEGQMRRVESGGGKRGRQQRELLALTRSLPPRAGVGRAAPTTDGERTGVSWRR